MIWTIGHVHKLDETGRPQIMSECQPVRKRERGAPALTWKKCIKRATMDQTELVEEDWSHSELWREET